MRKDANNNCPFGSKIIETIILSALFLLPPTSYLFAQRIIPSFETLNVNEGLTQSSVYAIHQDRFGYMWVGTADGLNRYDGTRLKQFKIENDKLDIESNFVRGNLAEDEEGNVWYCNESGIYCFEHFAQKIRSIHVFEKSDFRSSIFMCLAIKDGYLWMSNATHGVFSFSLKTKKLEHYFHKVFNPSSDPYHFNSSINADGKIWIAFSDNRGLWNFDTKTKFFLQYDARHHYNNIHFGNKKHFLFSEKGILIYDSVTGKTYKDSIWTNAKFFKPAAIFEDPQNRIWATSQTEGLAYYDPQHKQIWHLQHHNTKLKSLPNNLVSCYLIDNAQNLWIGTDGGGVCFVDLKPSKFNLFPQDEGDYTNIDNFFTKSFFEDAQERIWVGSHDAGLNIIEPYSLKVKNISQINGKKLCAIGAVFQDNEHQMWIGHSMGLAIFNEQKNSFREIDIDQTIPLKYGSPYINDLRQLPSGALIAATQWGLLFIAKKHGIYSVTDYYKQQYLGAQALSISISDEGKIWVASPTSGLLNIAQQGDSLVFLGQYFKGVNVRSVYIDKEDKNIVWVATAKGLVWLDTKTRKFKIFNEKDGLANSFIYGILSDEFSNLWMSTNGGLVYFDRAKNNFVNYTVYDGLQSNEFNTGAFYKSKSGTFYFGGIKGFNWFKTSKPQLPIANNYMPKVALSDIYVNDQYYAQSISFSQAPLLNLNHYQNKLSFTFSVLDFTTPRANKICYQLKGWDKDWICGYEKSIVYQNLSPGSYELLYKGINGNEQESEVQHVYLHIHQPFWQTWWFLFLIFLIVISIVVFGVRLYTQNAINKKIRLFEKQKAIAEERNRISRDMHDEIGSGLTHIALITELIQTQKKTENELRKEVGNISSSAQKLVGSMSEIIWALNPDNDTLENLLSYLREQTRNYFEPFDIEYEINFPNDIPFFILSNEKRRNLFLVAKEALNNALKYAQARKIDFNVSILNNTLSFEIADDGCGFDRDKIRRGANGLLNMQKRIDDIGGNFLLKTTTQGTSVYFDFPLAE